MWRLGAALSRRLGAAGRGPSVRSLSSDASSGGNPITRELRLWKKIHWTNWSDFLLGMAPSFVIIGAVGYYKMVLVPAQDKLVEDNAEDFAAMDAANDKHAEDTWEDIRRRRKAMYEARGLEYKEYRGPDGVMDWDAFERRWSMVKSGKKWYEFAAENDDE